MAFKNFKERKFFSKFFGILCIFSLECNCGFRPSPLERESGQGPEHSSLFASLPESGEYFSELKKIPTGFYIRQIYLNHKTKNEFYMSQLTVSEAKNWEEIRFEGKLTKDDSGKLLRFRPRLCRIFTSKNPGDRWALVRAFECDHFEFLIWKAGLRELRIVPGPEGEEDGVLFRRPNAGTPEKISGIVLRASGKNTSVWGMRLSRVRKGAKGQLETYDGRNLDLRSLQTVETTGEAETTAPNLARPGDFILYTNPNSVNPLAYE
ncbi:hypothetical protein ACE5IS_11925 [Leptospira wolffii]|uniref:Lipoprotein n=1 Tax=Leptospira wolffii TaxID=409998 RepID=A0ABV5BNT6_9LEPT|nr:hypothetical protein [Leptospira wolffii]EPG66101.1 hypothetical protein LEP1GSC061_2346 [Leptospira wolffii serovar Khorat str. Khorat-H2]TGL47616.1 hypothetical protein EHQ61_16065 [Leptospira wolffii]